MAGFKWSIDWDTNPIRRGGKEASDAIEDAADVFEDFAKEVDDSTDKAKTDLDSLEKAMKDAADAADFKKTGKSIGDDVRKGTRDAEGGLSEFKDEANSTAREAAASFDGSADSIAEGFQEVAANAFAGFGPAGAVAGLGIAAGIGIGIAALQMSAEEATAAKQKIIDLAGSINEAGGDIRDIDWGEQFREFGNEIADAKSWFDLFQEDSVTNFEKIQEAADRFGLDYQTLFQGMAGDTEQATDALGDVESALSDAEAELARMEQAEDRMSQSARDARAEQRGQVDDLKALRDSLEEASGMTEEAIEHERRWAEAIEGSAAGIAEKNEQLRETAELTADVIGSELDWLDTLEATTAALAENASAGFDKHTAAGRENLRGLKELADGALSYSESIMDAGGSQAQANEQIRAGRDAVVNAGIALGMSEDQAREYARSLGLIPREVKTEAKAETSAAEDALKQTARDRSAKIDATADTSSAERELNRIASKTYRVSMTPIMGQMRVV